MCAKRLYVPRVVSFVGISLACLISWGCGGEWPEIGSGSQDVIAGEQHSGDPAVVALRIGSGLCTGTLISNRVIVTAAHCLNGTPLEGVEVRQGMNGMAGELVGRSIHHVSHGDADLALVLLDRDSGIAPMAVVNRNVDSAVGQGIRLVGYGHDRDGVGAGIKRQGETVLNGTVSLDGYGECLEMGIGTENRSCQGDSGGPSFMTFGGIEYLVGAVSHGTGASCEGEETITRHVRLDAYRSWIETYVDEHDPSGMVPVEDEGLQTSQEPSGCASNQAGGFWVALFLLLVCTRRRTYGAN